MNFHTPGNPFAELLPDSPPETQPIGTLGEHLRVYGILRGGMGEVFLCGDTNSTAPQLALKTFQQRFFFSRAVRQAFVREASVWARLSGHPHIVPALGISVIDGRPFVSMPFVPAGDRGPTVRDLLAAGPPDPEVTLAVAMQTALGMSMARERVPGLVHGDLKPENLLLLGDWVLISDFGLARVITEESATELESTWAYRAPECWDGPLTQAADVYAYGTVLYELLAGEPPHAAAMREEWSAAHQSGTIKAPPLNGALGDGLMDVAMRCLCRDPRDRPAGFTEVVERLQGLADDHDPEAALAILENSARMGYFLHKQRSMFVERCVQSLLTLGEHELALDEIARLAPDEITAHVLRLHGNLLSLTGDDAAALVKLDEALTAGLSTEDELRCRSDYALSLKRLGRYEEAAGLLGELAMTTSPAQRAEFVGNLATVYIEQGKPEKARDHLMRAIAEHPEVWQLWGNLGLAQEALGQYDEAARSYQQAIGIAPHEPQLQVMLANVYRDNLDDSGTARTALSAAHDQGWAPGKTRRRRARRARLRVPLRPRKRPRPPSVVLNTLQPSTPFMNVRLYVPTDYFSVDFFYDERSPSYTTEFGGAFTEVTNQLRLTMPRFFLRSTPLYFTRCPGCDRHVLTNRNVGKELRCRWCETSAPTRVRHDDRLDRLRATVLDALGKKVVDLSDHVHLVLVDAADAARMDPVRALGAECGFTDVPANGYGAVWLRMEGQRRGVFSSKSPFLVALQHLDAGGSEGYADESPPAVESLVIKLREELGSLRSTSMTYAPSDDDYSMVANEGRPDELLERLRADLAKNPLDQSRMLILAYAALACDRHGEAENLVRHGVRMWPDRADWWNLLGRLKVDVEPGEAVAAFERSLGIDPVQPEVLLDLARCHRRLGDNRRARALEARGRSLGGRW